MTNHDADGQRFEVLADRFMCQGYAHCEATAPDIYHVDDTGKVVVARPFVSDPDDVALVQEAVLVCPMHALSMRAIDDDTAPDA